MCWGQQFFRGRRETVAVCVEPSRLGVSIAGTWHCAKNCLSFPFWWVVPGGIFAFTRELQHISSAVALTLFTLNMYYVAFILSVALFKIVFTLSLDPECTKQMSILNFSPLRQCLHNGEQNITMILPSFAVHFWYSVHSGRRRLSEKKWISSPERSDQHCRCWVWYFSLSPEERRLSSLLRSLLIIFRFAFSYSFLFLDIAANCRGFLYLA